MAFNALALDELSSIEGIINSNLYNFNNFPVKDFEYSGTTHYLMVNWVNPMFLKQNYTASKEDNTTWQQAMSRSFSDEYWKLECTQIDTLQKIVAWGVIKITDDMNVIDFTCTFKLK